MIEIKELRRVIYRRWWIAVFTPIFGAILFRIIVLVVGVEVEIEEGGGGDDGGAEWEIDVDGGAIGRGATGGGASVVSSLLAIGSKIQ